MTDEKAATTVTADEWAAAQVEAVAREVETKEKRAKRPPAKARGLWFRERPGGEVVGPNGTRGEWWVRWHDADSREHREKAGTKAAAVALYQKRKTEVRQGRHFPESLRRRADARLRDLVKDYLESARASQVKTADVIARRLAVVAEILGNPAAATVKPEDLERLKLKLAAGIRKASPKPASINRYLQDLKAVLCKAVKGGKLDRNPFLGVPLLTENNKRTRELSPDEEARWLAALDPAGRRRAADLRPFVRFLIETGARAGEVCELIWTRILWADGVAELPEPKAGEKQHLTLSRAALAVLEALPRIGPHVFCWPDGRPFTVDYATHALLRAARRAGIADLRQHDTRHTFAIRRLRGGANLVAVSALLRHASTRMTERYLHVTRDDLRAAVEAGKPESTGTQTGTSAGAPSQPLDS